MKKIFFILLTGCVAAATIFACCMQTQAFVTLVTQHKAHDCCKKSLPQGQSQNQNCECHHDISIAPSAFQMAGLVQNLIDSVAHFDFAFAVFPQSRFLQTASLYDDGPPVDHPVSEVPLFYQHHTLRL